MDGARGDLDTKTLHSVLDHLAGCRVCTEAWRLAMELEPRPEPTPEPTSEPVGEPFWRYWVDGATAAIRAPREHLAPLSGLAAALMMLIAVSVLVLQTSERPSRLRSAGSVVLELTSPAKLPRDACVLEWTAFPEALYDVRIASATEILLEATGLAEASYRVPVGVLEGVAVGEELSAHVEAYTAQDGSVASSTLVFEC